jgi:hypothetical protein
VLVLGQTPGTKSAKKFQVPATWITSVLLVRTKPLARRTLPRIVLPTDLSALRQSPSAQLTLITCYPTHYVGPAAKRLVVVARLITRFSTAGE